MPSWWWPGRRSRSRTKPSQPAAAAASAPGSPRHNCHDEVQPAAFAMFAWAAPNVRRGGETPRSVESPAARRGTSSAATRRCCGAGSEGGAVVVAGQGFPLPPPKSGSLPSASQAAAVTSGGYASPYTSVSGGSSSESDDAVEDHGYADQPVVYPGARILPPHHVCEQITEDNKKPLLVSCSENHRFFGLPITDGSADDLQSGFGASTSSRGRKFLHDETSGARTRSLSPRPRGQGGLASSYASPGDLGFGPRSAVKRMDDLKSRSQPLPLPPVPSSDTFLVPSSSSPTASAQSQSQWRKGKVLGSGTFGQVYLGFNRESGKLCAIKEVQVILDDSKSNEQLRQLNQEIDMLRKLSHQNIVQYYGSELISSFAEMRSFRGSPYWMAPEVIRNKKGYSLEVDIWSLGCTVIEMGTGRHPWHQYADVPAMFKIAYSKDLPEIPENFSKEGKDFLSLCLKRDPAQRPSATQLLGHPFLQDHHGHGISGKKCNIKQLRNGLSLPADSCQKKSSRGSSSKRSIIITPLLDIKGQSARDFTGLRSTAAHPSSGKASSSRIDDTRKNLSLPVSPCSSPLRQSNWSCLPSPSHPAFSYSSGSTTAHNPVVSYMQNNQMARSTAVQHDPWH